ncbi:MAG: hypothetical protein WBG36_08600 [Ornithinimicrobium sp.]
MLLDEELEAEPDPEEERVLRTLPEMYWPFLILIQPLVEVVPVTLVPRRNCFTTPLLTRGPERTLAIDTSTYLVTDCGAVGKNGVAGAVVGVAGVASGVIGTGDATLPTEGANVVGACASVGDMACAGAAVPRGRDAATNNNADRRRWWL